MDWGLLVPKGGDPRSPRGRIGPMPKYTKKKDSEQIKDEVGINGARRPESPAQAPDLGFNLSAGANVPHGLSPPASCSYCHLENTFSVYVYGAFPLPVFPPEITILLLMLAILLSVWLAYMIPKVLHTEWGRRVWGLWAHLGRSCARSCGHVPCKCCACTEEAQTHLKIKNV